MLLDNKNINIELGAQENFTPLCEAVRIGQLDTVKILCKKGANISTRTEIQRTPLSYAAEAGHTEVVNFLLEQKNIEINARDEAGHFPIHYAAKGDHIKVMDVLLKAGAHVNSSVLFYTAENGNFTFTEKIVNLLNPQSSLNELQPIIKMNPVHISAAKG